MLPSKSCPVRIGGRRVMEAEDYRAISPVTRIKCHGLPHQCCDAKDQLSWLFINLIYNYDNNYK